MPAIIILGGHRCGSSCVAGAIAQLGIPASLPGDAIGASPSNPRGHFEDRTLVRFHQQLLGPGGWRDPSYPASMSPQLRARYDAHLRRRARLERWLIKDPRLCVLLPLLLNCLAGLAVAPIVVSVQRDVDAVAESLRRRQRLPAQAARRIAALYEGARRAQLAWLASQSSIPLLELDYPQLLIDGRSTIAMLARFLGVPAGVKAVEFLDPALHHGSQFLPESP